MDLWNIYIVGIPILVAFLSIFLIPAFKIGKTFATFSDSIKNLNDNISSLNKLLDRFEKKNEEEHKEIFKTLQSHGNQLVNHDNRIEHLEEK